MKIDSTIVFLVLLIASRCWRPANAVSDELVAFQRALDDAKVQLLGIRNSVAIEGNEALLRKRRAAIDELLDNYQQDLNFDLDQEALQNAAADYPDRLLDNIDCKGGDCMKFPDYRAPGGKVKKKTSLSDELNALVRVNTRFRDLHKGMLNSFHKTNNNNAGLVDLSTQKTANSGDDSAKTAKVSSSVSVVNLSGRINPSEPAKLKSNSKTNLKSIDNTNANNDNLDAIIKSISNAELPPDTTNTQPAGAKANLFSNTNLKSNANSYANTKSDFKSNSNSFSNSDNSLNSFSNSNSKLNSFSNLNNNQHAFWNSNGKLSTFSKLNNNLNSFSNSNSRFHSFSNSNNDLNSFSNSNFNTNADSNSKFDSSADTNMDLGNGPQCKATSNANDNNNNKYSNNDIDMNTNDSPKASTSLQTNTVSNLNSNDQPTYMSCMPITNSAKSNAKGDTKIDFTASFKDISLDSLRPNGRPQGGNPKSSIDSILMLEADTVRNKINSKNNDAPFTGLNYIENNNYNGQSNGYAGSDYYGSNDNYYTTFDSTKNNNKDTKDDLVNKNLDTIDFDHYTNYQNDRGSNKNRGDDDNDDEVFTYEKTIENIHFPSIVNDQFDMIKNDLSHEANYKLSKIEQDAAERKKGPGGQRKPAINKETWNPSLKRSIGFNPLDEIKLKTSARLMSKGLGPSLPSYALSDTWRELQLDESVKKLEHDFNAQPKHDMYDKFESELSEEEKLWRQRMKRLDELEQKSLDTMLHIPDLESADGTPNAVESKKDNTDINDVLIGSTFDILRTKRLSDPKADDKLLDQPQLETLPLQQSQPLVQQPQQLQQQPPLFQQKLVGQPQLQLPQQQQQQQEAASQSFSNAGEIKVITLPDVAELSGLTAKPLTADKEEDGKLPSREAADTKTLPDGNAGGVTPTKRCAEGPAKTAAPDEQIFKAGSSDSGNEDAADVPRRRVKRIGVLNNDGVMTEVKEMNAEFLDDLEGVTRTKRAAKSDDSEKSPRVLKRRKRAIDINDVEVFQDGVDGSLDVSRVRRSVDANQNSGRRRQRRSRRSIAATTRAPVASTAPPPATTTDAATRKVKKRSTQLIDELDDDNNSNNRKLLDSALIPADGVSVAADQTGREENYADVVRKKRISDREYDLSNSIGEFGNQKFDNLKQRDERVHSFDGLKVDNLWYGDEKGNNNRRDKEIEAHKLKNQNKELHDAVDVEKENVRNAEASSGESNSNSQANGRSSDELKSELGDDERIEADAQLRGDKQPDKKMVLAVRDQILNCTAFSNLESFLRTLQRNNKTNGGGGGDAADGGDKMAVEVQVKPAKVSPKLLSKPPQGDGCGESKKPPHHKQQGDMMKLNITINASVLGDQKAKNFFGNGTFKVQSEERERRGIPIDELDRFTKRKCPKVEKSGCGNAEVDSLASGKVSAGMVKSMFSLVKCSPKLRTLWPSLRRNQLSLSSEPHELNAVSNMDKADANRVEEMVEKAMEAINDIIQDEVEARSCMPLRSDLKGFYDQILQMYKPDCGRDKREMVALTSDFSKQVRAIDPSKIEEKSRIVKKLLRQYDDLSMEDQQSMADLRQDLMQNLFYLRRLQEEQAQAQDDEQQERGRRELDDEREMRQLEMDDRQLRLDRLDTEQQEQQEQEEEEEDQQRQEREQEDDLLKKLGSSFTPQYLKLLKASELNSERAAEQEEQN